ncbi:dTMP kinase [uncultured Adlercreutzia sp.]|uniref:dTMP kinase n=1 Tax=uncultured Adlercreutzia sp. TaxID=875803 RepID=UPI002675F8A5|nr:dTMP kinase [uncultured Adlercreutzia sp.]
MRGETMDPIREGAAGRAAEAPCAKPSDDIGRASSAAEPPRGLFITFEGGDGAGKSTQIRFLARFLEERGCEVLRLREPGGTAVGESLRRVVLDPAHGAMSDRAELLIYEAARAQIVDEVIKPALGRGAVVLCDRFYDSTVAYQGAGRGLDGFFIEAANRFACDGLAPDATVLLVASEEVVRSRMGRREGADRLERAGDAFHRRVADGFEELAAADPARVHRVESQLHRADTFRAVLAALDDVLPGAAEALAADDSSLDVLVTEVMEEKRRERARERRRKDARKRRRDRKGDRGGKDGRAGEKRKSKDSSDGKARSGGKGAKGRKRSKGERRG